MSKKASKTTSRLQQSAVHIPRSRAGLFARSNSPHALKRLWPAALILAIGLSAAFANSFGAGLVVDSAIIIGHDPRLADANWENVHLILSKNYWWPTFGSDLYRPVTTLTYLFNYSVLGNGNNVLGYHIINLLLHWINAVLVFLLARRLLGQFWLALFVAAIFSLHPLTVKCVTNIVGRADLLSTLLILAGLLCHILQYEVGGWRRAWCLIGLGLAADQKTPSTSIEVLAEGLRGFPLRIRHSGDGGTWSADV